VTRGEDRWRNPPRTESVGRTGDSQPSTVEVAQIISVALIRVPISLFVGSIEICARAMRHVERIVGAGIDSVLAGSMGPPVEPIQTPPSSGGPAARVSAAAIVQEEEQQEVSMTDTNLSDDMVKLVEYEIVSIKRDEERFVHQAKQLVTENMTGESFSAWMIAKYLESPEYKEAVARDKSFEISPEDRQFFLRVNYDVQARWAREEPEYDRITSQASSRQAAAAERQAKILEGVQKKFDKLADKIDAGGLVVTTKTRRK